MSGRRTSGTSRPSLGAQVLAVFSFISWGKSQFPLSPLRLRFLHPAVVLRARSKVVVWRKKLPRAGKGEQGKRAQEVVSWGATLFRCYLQGSYFKPQIADDYLFRKNYFQMNFHTFFPSCNPIPDQK